MRKIYLLLCLLLSIAATRAQNTAVTFDGVNDYIDCGNNASLAANTIRTMECWVKFATTSGDREILSKSISGQGIELLQFGGNLAVYCMYNGSNASFLTYSMSNFKTGVWYHLAFSWNGTKESMKLYVNGASVGAITHVGNINTTGIANPGGSFRIGQWADVSSRPFQGSIDEVRVWNINRSASDIKKDMLKSVAVNTTGLVAYYKLNEGSGTAAANSTSVAGLNGSLVNGPIWSASPVQSSSNALHLASNKEHVVVPANPLLNLTTGTVECWIKPSAMNYNGCILGVRGIGGTRYSFHINTTNQTIGLWNNDEYTTVSYPFVAGMWYHVAFVCDGTNTQVYINGNYIDETNTAFSNITGQPLVIGVAKDQSYDSEGSPMGEVINEPFLGEIDEVRIWSSQRTPTEINNNKDLILSGSETGLLAQYTFNQGIAGGNNSGVTIALDQTTNNLHGTLTNFALTGSTSNYSAHTMILLPVTWTSFVASKKETSVVLQWQTALEQDSRLFIVERSQDGHSFKPLGSVPASGSKSVYVYTDDQPQQGINYYRIKQTDRQNQAAYSAVCAVSMAMPGTLKCINDQNGSVTLMLKGGANEHYIISDMSGRIVQRGQLSGGKATTVSLHRGAYIASLLQGGEGRSVRFIIP